MPLKTIKKETANTLCLEWVLHIKNYKLDLDKIRCSGCQICSLACPKEAITVSKTPKVTSEKAQKARVDLDLAKCNFCGICDVLCPYGAIKLTVDGKHILSAVEKESFPLLIRDIKADPTKFPIDPKIIKDACPLGLITALYSTKDEKSAKNPTESGERERNGNKPIVNIDKEHCPCCTVCETRLPCDAMNVRKFISGRIVVNKAECPDGCTDCLDVCPITGVLYLSKEDKKVHVDETHCVYCGACKTICPVDAALDLKRTRILHTPVRSGTWNKALERLTSTTDLTKELKTKGSQKARDAVKMRMVQEARDVA